MRKLVLALLGLVAMAVPVAAQQSMAWSLYAYDVSAGSYTYCIMKGNNGDPYGQSMTGPAQIKTTGSSTTVTENVASTNPFTNLNIGDMIEVVRDPVTGVTDRVSITAKASNASVTVSATVNWSNGYNFRWRQLACGTAVTDGWAGTGTFNTACATIEYVTKNATSLDYQVECAIGAGLPIIVKTESATAVGQWGPCITAGVYDRCRIGMKLTGDVGVQVVNAHIEVKK
jgi:hypothetical protein